MAYIKEDKYDEFVTGVLMSNYKQIIEQLGENPEREGLQKTPERVAKAMQVLTQGYHMNAHDIINSAKFHEDVSEMIIVKDIELYSLCEHHMLPFWGSASVAYYPDRQILGLSKIPRLIDLFARRLQVQERLTEDIAQAMMLLIKPRAVLVRANGHHLCMMMRGVEKQQSFTTTEVIKGAENLSPDELNRLYSVVQD